MYQRERKKIIKKFSLGLVQKSQKCFLLVIKQQNMFFDYHAISLEASGPNTMWKSSPRPRNTFYAFSTVNSLSALFLFLLVSFKKKIISSVIYPSASPHYLQFLMSTISITFAQIMSCSHWHYFLNHGQLKLYFYSNLFFPLILWLFKRWPHTLFFHTLTSICNKNSLRFASEPLLCQ